MGATTRDPNIDIPVETGTPPIFRERGDYEGCDTIPSSRLREIEEVDDRSVVS